MTKIAKVGMREEKHQEKNTPQMKQPRHLQALAYTTRTQHDPEKNTFAKRIVKQPKRAFNLKVRGREKNVQTKL